MTGYWFLQHGGTSNSSAQHTHSAYAAARHPLSTRHTHSLYAAALSFVYSNELQLSFIYTLLFHGFWQTTARGGMRLHWRVPVVMLVFWCYIRYWCGLVLEHQNRALSYGFVGVFIIHSPFTQYSLAQLEPLDETASLILFQLCLDMVFWYSVRIKL